MPPKRRPVNVVRSGNAGNSSKAKPKDDAKDAKGGGKGGKGKDDTEDKPARPPPLFPVGYKSPVTILNEKCQKMGWERPVIETVSGPHRCAAAPLVGMECSCLGKATVDELLLSQPSSQALNRSSSQPSSHPSSQSSRREQSKSLAVN